MYTKWRYNTTSDMSTQLNKFYPDLLRELVSYTQNVSELCKLVYLREDTKSIILESVRTLSELEADVIDILADLPNLREILQPIQGRSSIVTHLLSHPSLCKYKLCIVSNGWVDSFGKSSILHKLVAKPYPRDSLVVLGHYGGATEMMIVREHLYLDLSIFHLLEDVTDKRELWCEYGIPCLPPCLHAHIVINLGDMEDGGEESEPVRDGVEALCDEVLVLPLRRASFHYIHRQKPWATPHEDVDQFFRKFLLAFTKYMMLYSSRLSHLEEFFFPASGDIDLNHFVDRFPQMPYYEFVVDNISQVRCCLPRTQKRVTFYRLPGSFPSPLPFETQITEYPIYRSVEECMKAYI